jgi:isoleucyl-tRNA synthetase
VHVAFFPEPPELTVGLDAAARQRGEEWDRLMQVRESVLKSLETARNDKIIGAPLEARVRLSVNPEIYPLLKQYARELPALFIVSQVALERAGLFSVQVERAAGRKCERCWKYTIDTGADARFPTICGACAQAVEEICHDRH